MASNRQPISNISELKSLLGNHFVVLFGSAVSGVMEPSLPMIDDVTHTFLSQSASRLYSGSYRQKVIAEYAQDLVSGYHNAQLRLTKFENFIFRLQNSIGKEPVDELFFRMFRCTGKQYNSNHSALAFLLRKRVCLAAFTTNFDNQLELCLPGIHSYVYPKRPTRIPSARARPILVKLHGDALSKTCVATSPQLSEARSLHTYSFIEDLLRDQVVLVLGYSGTGDIDIAPHLGKHERCVIWGNYSVDLSKPKLANQIDCLCDLSLTEPGMEKQAKRNLLLELAASYGWKPPVKKFANAKLSWKDELVDWTQQIPLENLQDFIISFVSWRTSWPDVHLTYLGLKENSSYKHRLDYALSTVQVAAYTSSEKLLKPLFLTEPPNLRSVISVIHHLGFTYWGQRRYQMALSTFLGLLKAYDLALLEWQAQPNADIKKHVSSSARHYLEILIEVIHNIRGNTERRDFVRNTAADYVLSLFGQLKLERSYLNQIAILETQYWLGMPVSLVAARELFNQCMAMQEWEAAALVAQFLLILDRMDGQKAAHEILPQLQKRGSWKLMTKVYASLIYERLNRRIPVQVLNFKAFTNILLVAVELIFALKRFIWDLDQRLGWIRIETGFLGIGHIVSRNK